MTVNSIGTALSIPRSTDSSNIVVALCRLQLVYIWYMLYWNKQLIALWCWGLWYDCELGRHCQLSHAPLMASYVYHITLLLRSFVEVSIDLILYTDSVGFG